MDAQTLSDQNLKKRHQVQIAVWKARRALKRLTQPLMWRNFFLLPIGLTLLYLAFNLYIGAQWVDQPYAGFLHQNRVILTSSALEANSTDDSSPQAITVSKGSIIAAVDRQPVPSSAWLIDYLQQSQESLHEYSLLRPDGRLTSIKLPVVIFDWQDFIQMVAIPALVGMLILITAGAMIYIGYNLFITRLFALFCLVLAFPLISFPALAPSGLAPFSSGLALVSTIMLPSLLMHLLLLVYQPNRVLEKWPFLLPLIYLPVVPGLIHLPQLFSDPVAHRNLMAVIAGYTLIYTAAACFLLLMVMLKSRTWPSRTRAVILLLSLTFPTFLLLINLSLAVDRQPQQLLLWTPNRYWFACVPFAAFWLAVRYEDFGFKVAQRSYLLYLRTLLIGLLSYICLITILNPAMSAPALVHWQDIPIILIGAAIFFVVRLLAGNLSHLTAGWIHGSIVEFRNGYRLVARNLTRVESRRDLERLVGLDLPSDFRLRGAEITATNKEASIRHTLAYPLMVNNVQVGTLYLGEKIGGNPFTPKELEIIDELTKQISLAVWSFELDENIQKVEELTRLKSRFLAHVTHELRTPLNGIINYIGFVLDDGAAHLNREQTVHLERALSRAEQLLKIINNILDMSKIEAGQMNLHRQPVNLIDIITEITPIIEQQIESNPVELITDVAPNLPEVTVDRLRLRQVFLNLLFNAAKFTEAGTIHLKLWAENGTIFITVADTGPGIDDRFKPTVFEQFMSAGLLDADQNLGPGLSMPITKALVELHGGRIDLISQPGVGTIFTVTLPVEARQSTNGYKSEEYDDRRAEAL